MPSTAMCLHISVRNNKNGISDEIKWNKLEKLYLKLETK